MKYLSLFLLLIPSICFAQSVKISDDLSIAQLTDRVYLYTSWADMGEWGRVGSNGMVVVDGAEAFMCDTPVDEAQTRDLVDHIASALGAKLIYFIPGHWHSDCVGGMGYLNKQGVNTYANALTNSILKSKNRPTAKHSFADSLTLKLGKTEIKAYFLGGGHATDNIVVWLPNEKILFGGCMVKDTSSTGKGNTADAAPLWEWIATIEQIERKFPDATTIIPGHGNYGGTELLTHTKTLLNQ